MTTRHHERTQKTAQDTGSRAEWQYELYEQKCVKG